MTDFRLNREKNSGMVGPAIATPSANRLIKSPACTTVTPYRSAI